MLEKHLLDITKKIKASAKSANRESSKITLVAVSKRVDVERVAELYQLGHFVFGENYVQEGVSKYEACKQRGFEHASFHLIGNIQSNKVKKVVGVFELIHTLDRKKIINEVAKVAEANGLVQSGLLQVNISGESSKSGIDEDELPLLLEHALSKSSLDIQGLMCIGASDVTIEQKTEEFSRMKALKIACEKQFDIELPHLSMGMSGDFELAVEHGATLVRVGSALFGARV